MISKDTRLVVLNCGIILRTQRHPRGFSRMRFFNINKMNVPDYSSYIKSVEPVTLNSSIIRTICDFGKIIPFTNIYSTPKFPIYAIGGNRQAIRGAFSPIERTYWWHCTI